MVDNSIGIGTLDYLREVQQPIRLLTGDRDNCIAPGFNSPLSGLYCRGPLAQSSLPSQLRDGYLVLISAICAPGLHYLTLTATDIYGALAVLARADYALIGLVSRPGSRRSQIAFMHPKSLNGVLMHLVEHEQR